MTLRAGGRRAQPSAYKAGGPSKRPSRGSCRRDGRRAAHPPASGDCMPAATKLARPGRLARQQDGHDAKNSQLNGRPSCSDEGAKVPGGRRWASSPLPSHPPSPSTAVAARRATSQRRGGVWRWRGGEAFDAVCMGARPPAVAAAHGVIRDPRRSDPREIRATTWQRGGATDERMRTRETYPIVAATVDRGGCLPCHAHTTYTKYNFKRGMWQRSVDLP